VTENVTLSTTPPFFSDLYLFVRDFEVPEFSRKNYKGYWFQDRVFKYFDSDDKYDVRGISGDMQLLDISAASGLRHETDLLIEYEDRLYVFEDKCVFNVPKNELLIFNQKCLDFWIRFVQLDETRPLYRVFVSKTNLEYPLREFAYMWNVILIEPDLLPIPTILEVLHDENKCRELEIYAAYRHIAFLEKGCRHIGNLLRRDPDKSGVIRLDTRDIPCKGNLELSSDHMYLKHRQLSKKIRKKYFDITSTGYEEAVRRIEDRIGYTQGGKPK
jgi:hypothetical protein